MEDSHDTKAVSNEDVDNWTSCSHVFSEDSSFYGLFSFVTHPGRADNITPGDEQVKTDLRQRAAVYNPRAYWDILQWNIQCLAAKSADWRPQGTKREIAGGLAVNSFPMKKHHQIPHSQQEQSEKDTVAVKPVRSFNPYEGNLSAKQVSETVEEFLVRLKPSAARITDCGPWIWIANPRSPFRPLTEDIAGFKQEASRILADYLSRKTLLEQQHPVKVPSSITRMLKPERDFLSEQIMALAKRFGVVHGKWMLFPTPENVDKVWSIVAQATVGDELGCSAKVATDHGDSIERHRLLCIYTLDFSDTHDVERVLLKMRQLGLVGNESSRAIYYKSDAFTHLDINANNEYKLKASLYSSNDFAEMAG